MKERSKGIEDREMVMQSVVVTTSRVPAATQSVVQPVGFGGSSASGSKEGLSMVVSVAGGSSKGNSVGSKQAKEETDQGGGAKARKSKKKGNVSIISSQTNQRKTHSGTQNDKTRKWLGLKDKKSSRKSTKSKKTS